MKLITVTPHTLLFYYTSDPNITHHNYPAIGLENLEMHQNNSVPTQQIQNYSRNHNILSITYPDLELSSEHFYIQPTYTQV